MVINKVFAKADFSDNASWLSFSHLIINQKNKFLKNIVLKYELCRERDGKKSIDFWQPSILMN